jgi:hypothetical protein
LCDCCKTVEHRVVEVLRAKGDGENVRQGHLTYSTDKENKCKWFV